MAEFLKILIKMTNRKTDFEVQTANGLKEVMQTINDNTK